MRTNVVKPVGGGNLSYFQHLIEFISLTIAKKMLMIVT